MAIMTKPVPMSEIKGMGYGFARNMGHHPLAALSGAVAGGLIGRRYEGDYTGMAIGGTAGALGTSFLARRGVMSGTLDAMEHGVRLAKGARGSAGLKGAGQFMMKALRGMR